MSRDTSPKFLKRIRERRRSVGIDKPGNHDGKPQQHALQDMAHISQIILVVVAIFGYIFTVRPIYQKERLAEELARIESGLDEAELNLALAEKLTAEYEVAASVAEEKANALRVDVERQTSALATLREERDSVQNQLTYMKYAYLMPDGSPADTAEKVALVRRNQYRNQFFEAIESRVLYIQLVGSGMRGKDPIPFFNLFAEVDEGASHYPFTEKELDLWETHGRGYPAFAATEIISSVRPKSIIAEIEREGGVLRNEDLQNWQGEAIGHIRLIADEWVPMSEPNEIISKLHSDLQEIEQGASADSRKARQDSIMARYHAEAAANGLRDSVSNQVRNLLEFDTLNLPPNRWDQPVFPEQANEQLAR